MIDTEGTVDIGFIRRGDGVFVGVSSSNEGGLDIFTHDVILRTHERHVHRELPLARTVLYETDGGMVHLRLFDGRPGSPTFPGVAPNQAAQAVKDEGDISWGCFLDPGQTAKLVVRNDADIASYGNTHYLKWPQLPGDKFVWVPKTGRPVASMITLR